MSQMIQLIWFKYLSPHTGNRPLENVLPSPIQDNKNAPSRLQAHIDDLKKKINSLEGFAMVYVNENNGILPLCKVVDWIMRTLFCLVSGKRWLMKFLKKGHDD